MKAYISILALFGLLVACTEQQKQPSASTPAVEESASFYFIPKVTSVSKDAPLEFSAFVPETGRYRITVYAADGSAATVWLEDYINNEDDRTYNITGNIDLTQRNSVDGSPLAQGDHPFRLYADTTVSVDSIGFELMYAHTPTSNYMEQSMDGEAWELVWSDEFEGSGLPDLTKWSYNVGNWGWGNNEPQYYTDARTENARLQDGNLVIEAVKNDMGQPWTSARLTTQGKVAFTYGRIEFRAKVPEGRGTWAAGWLLGDAYQDEISWPYCGEIDVLECVGYEIDDATGAGINHATCHTRAYYFKQGNQIGSEIAIDSMNSKFHTYAIEWYPDRVEGYLDGEKYYVYDKNANDLEWPFNNPQAIIVNLAVGGGWGGLKGIDENYDRHQYILDYVRVYQKK